MTKPAMVDVNETITNYAKAVILPLKFVGCWDWFPNPTKEYHRIINNYYLGFVFFILANSQMSLYVHLYTDTGANMMERLLNLADGLPVLVCVLIVAYFAANKQELYDLVAFMNGNFKFHSAKGLTNMTMRQSYVKANCFARFYTVCSLFSVVQYLLLPVIVHLWTGEPIALWMYKGVSRRAALAAVLARQSLTQALVWLAFGQLGVFFFVNAILLCGQYDLLCCSIRNARYTALLRRGVPHAALARTHGDIVDDEKHNYMYNAAQMKESEFYYDEKVTDHFAGKDTQFDIYSPSFDEATCEALRDCARAGQALAEYRRRFERFISPLLAFRVVQVTMYLCTLLYAATMKFDMATAEYLVAVTLDIFLYCYFANQVVVQADRVSTAAYTSLWPAAGGRPRRLLLNLLLSHRKAVAVRAGSFLPMDLNTFVVILKTSFSYYTLLVNVNEKKK